MERTTLNRPLPHRPLARPSLSRLELMNALSPSSRSVVFATTVHYHRQLGTNLTAADASEQVPDATVVRYRGRRRHWSCQCNQPTISHPFLCPSSAVLPPPPRRQREPHGGQFSRYSGCPDVGRRVVMPKRQPSSSRLRWLSSSISTSDRAPFVSSLKNANPRSPTMATLAYPSNGANSPTHASRTTFTSPNDDVSTKRKTAQPSTRVYTIPFFALQ